MSNKILDRYRPHKRIQLECLDASRAQQHMRDECNINLIMRKFEKTGALDHLNTHNGDYGDYTSYNGYHDAMNIVSEANEMFASIPSKIREQFKNDPSIFLQFAQDPTNVDQMIDLGLATSIQKEASIESSSKKAASPPPSKEEPATAPETEA